MPGGRRLRIALLVLHMHCDGVLQRAAMKKLATLAFIVAAACGSKDKDSDKGGGGDKKTIELGTTGFVVDVPESCVLDAKMEGFFDFDKCRPSPQIMVSRMKASTADEIEKSRCEGQSDIKKESLAGGGVLVTCKGPSKMMEGVTTTKIVAEIPKDDQSSFKCHLETDKDADQVIAICKSIRKK
jgi:hypothetical protein